MEYIKFTKSFLIKDILEILTSLNVKYNFDRNLAQEVIGIANGLYKIDKTLCFIENITVIGQLEGMNNALILTNSINIGDYSKYNIIVLDDCRYVFIKLVEYLEINQLLMPFSSRISFENKYISTKAKIHQNAVLEDNVVVEENVVIAAGCVIKNGTYIGKNSIVRENTTIGCDGIALYKAKNGEVLRFPHIAGVCIGENVEIGANCVIVRGNLFNTFIGNNTVLGNLSNVGHGAIIKEKVWISVGGLVGGNTIINSNSTIGLGVSFKDRIVVGENVTIGMGSIVTKSIPDNITVFGNPAKPIRPLNVGPKR